MKWIIIILISFVILYFLVKNGNDKFWKLVSKRQFEAYDFFIKNDCWFVIHPGEKIEKPSDSNWIGPFFVIIVGIGRLKIYGKKGCYEKKQEEFIQNLK